MIDAMKEKQRKLCEHRSGVSNPTGELGRFPCGGDIYAGTCKEVSIR